jgi:DNA (cytosine-5)-methyltransferase 1
MALGFSEYFEIVHAVDKERQVVRTYGANHPETQVRQKDLRLLTGARGDYEGITGVIGGPPCQGSAECNTGRRKKWAGAVDLDGVPITWDPRNDLMMEFIRFVREVRPRFFVMENVPKVPDPLKEQVITTAKADGFEVLSLYLTASDYGAAQTRKRWIVIGIREGHFKHPAKRPAMTVRQAFSGLGEGWGFMQSRPATIATLAGTLPGSGWQHMTEKRRYKGMCRLSWDEPAPTIVNLKKVYMVHPQEDRNLNLAEGAALQGFPPGYIWKGTDTDIAQMIADAMPAPLASAIAGGLVGG